MLEKNLKINYTFLINILYIKDVYANLNNKNNFQIM